MILNGLYVAVGAFFGAIGRYVISNWIDRKMQSRFPFGTIVVNIIGSFLLGIIIAKGTSNVYTLLFGTGFMGSFTTFSSFKLQTVNLGLEKEWVHMSRYLIYSYGLGLTFAFLGILIGQ